MALPPCDSIFPSAWWASTYAYWVSHAGDRGILTAAMALAAHPKSVHSCVWCCGGPEASTLLDKRSASRLHPPSPSKEFEVLLDWYSLWDTRGEGLGVGLRQF